MNQASHPLLSSVVGLPAQPLPSAHAWLCLPRNEPAKPEDEMLSKRKAMSLLSLRFFSLIFGACISIRMGETTVWGIRGA